MSGSSSEVRADPGSWAEFGAAQSQEQFLSSWLAILCTQIDGVTGGLLLIASGEANTFTPGAIWPDAHRDMTHLGPVAQQALSGRRGVVIPHSDAATAGAFVAYPVEVAGELKGAVVLDTAPRPAPELQHALRLVHWAIAWLTDLFRQQLVRERDATLDRMALVNSIVATALQERRFRACAMAVANDLAMRLACARVSIGFERSGAAEIEAMSHTASFDPKASQSRLIADAMDEVLDLGTAATHPAEGDESLVSAAQGALAAGAGAGAVLSVPLVSGGAGIGAVVFERDAGAAFDARTVATCTTLGLLLGPILDLKRDNERGALRRAWDGSREGVRAVFGPRHGGAKLIAVVALATVLFLSLAAGDTA